MSDFIWILGPCSMENELLYISVAKRLASIMDGREWYYKSSFDKANRTSIRGGRGPGLDEGLKIFEKLKNELPNIKLTTDIHEPWQAPLLAPFIDVIQVPAFLCRQTDLIIACAENFDIVNVKKGQWLGPRNIIKTVDKITETNPNTRAWLTERGSAFGHEHLIIDFTIVDTIKNSGWEKFIIDCTHSVQRSRKVYGVQGDRELAKRYFLSSKIMGYDGLFAETHPFPENATADGDCQLYLDHIENLVKTHDAIGTVL